jgi:NADH-quinone oxidoreductase subunit N
MGVGALGGLVQRDFQRLIGYSAIHHTGFLIAALVEDTCCDSLILGIYMLVYIPMVLMAFGLGFMMKKRSDVWAIGLDEFKGIAQHRPLFGAFVGILMLSMAGLPPFGGFLAKMSLVMALVGHTHFVLASIAVLSSVISVAYCLKVVNFVYFHPSPQATGGVAHGVTYGVVNPFQIDSLNRVIMMGLFIVVAGFCFFAPWLPFVDSLWSYH